MRRNGTAVLATGAILGGAAIGVGATLALFGDPLDRVAGVEVECGEVGLANAEWTASLIETVGPGGRVRIRRCPGGGWSHTYLYGPGLMRYEYVLPRAGAAPEGAEKVRRIAGWKTSMSFERAPGSHRGVRAAADHASGAEAEASPTEAAADAPPPLTGREGRKRKQEKKGKK